MEEIIKAIEAEKVRSKMSKTRNSGLYRLGLCKAIEIILEQREGKETFDEPPPSNCIKPAVSNLAKLIQNQKDIDPEILEAVNKIYWDLI